MAESDLVTAIIPAYNAAVTIDETLLSVRSQTHRHLEILVIDDGSRDATAEIVTHHAAQDGRVRLIRESNSGVAAARNLGIAEAKADLIAPIDADDLWSPDKIEKQILAVHRSDPDTALVYTWFAVIDENSRIIGHVNYAMKEGAVLQPLLRYSMIGNASSALMRKAAVLEVGGYDPSLRARAVQGCEDHKLYLRMAERHRFALVPEFLTGYRQTATNMSGDTMQMFRSWSIVADEMSERWPKFRDEIEAGKDDFLVWLLRRAQTARRKGDVVRLTSILLRRNPRVGFEATMRLTSPWVMRALLRRIGVRPRPSTVQMPSQFVIGIPTTLSS